MAARKAPVAAIAPPKWTKADVYAFKALAAGKANDAQQRRALDWLIYEAARAYDVSFEPDSERSTCFAEGRRFVGLQVIKLVNLPGNLLQGIKDE